MGGALRGLAQRDSAMTLDHRSGPAVDVVVPSYRRPDDLARCLDGLGRQTLAAQKVIVALRPDDIESHAVVDDALLPQLEVAPVTTGGQLAAISAGFGRTTSPVVAITDDDSVPSPQWLERLVALLEGRLDVGAVGGRDRVVGSPDLPTENVGRLRWWGGYVGNHHCGTGPVREVDILKGVNLMFRADAAALPAPGLLRGRGSEIHWEILVCSHLRRRGLRLLYDPEAVVDHNVAPRFDEDQRSGPSASAVVNLAHNQLMATAGLSPPRRPVHFLAGVLVGSRATPGFARALVAVVRKERSVWRRLPWALRGRVMAYRRLGLWRSAAMVPARRAGPQLPLKPGRAPGTTAMRAE